MVLPIILSIIAGLAFLLVLLLSSPVDFALMVHRDERTRVQVRVRWLLVTFQKNLLPRERRAAKPSKEEKPKPPKKKGGPTRWPRYVLAVLRSEGFLLRVIKLGPELLRNLRLRELFLNLRVGLEDPALTGEVYGGLCSVLIPMQTLPGSFVQVEPYFDGLTLDGEFETEIRVVPGRLAGTMLAFVLSPPILRAGRALLRERFK